MGLSLANQHSFLRMSKRRVKDIDVWELGALVNVVKV
jgi:hypothetical protein